MIIWAKWGIFCTKEAPFNVLVGHLKSQNVALKINEKLEANHSLQKQTSPPYIIPYFHA